MTVFRRSGPDATGSEPEGTDDEHRHTGTHQGAAPHPVVLRCHLGRLLDDGPVDHRRLGTSLVELRPEAADRALLAGDRLEQLVVLLDGDLDGSVACHLDGLNGLSVFGHVLSLSLLKYGCWIPAWILATGFLD